MVTEMIGSIFNTMARCRAGTTWTPCPRPRESLILIEVKHVEYMTLTIDQQHTPAVDDALQIAGQLGQLIFTSQRQCLSFVLSFRRQTPATMNLPLRSKGQFRTLNCCRRKVRGMLVDAGSDNPAIAQRKQGSSVVRSRRRIRSWGNRT